MLSIEWDLVKIVLLTATNFEGRGDLRELRPDLLPLCEGRPSEPFGEAVLVQVPVRRLPGELAPHARDDPGCAQLQVRTMLKVKSSHFVSTH